MVRISLFLLLLSGFCYATVEPFALSSASWLTSPQMGGPGYEIGYLNANPAGLGFSRTSALYLGSGTPYLDYTPLSAGIVLPFAPVVVGVYFATLQSTDAIHTSRTSDRPVSEGAIRHQFNLATVSLGLPIDSNLGIGATLSWEDQVLYSSRGSGYSFDLGAHYRSTFWWAGVYTQHLFSTGYAWASHTDSFSQNVSLDMGLYWDRLQLGTTVGLLSHRIYVKLPLHPMLSLSADTELDSHLAVTHYRFGVLCDLPGVGLQYTHLQAANSNLELSQDLVGVVVNW